MSMTDEQREAYFDYLDKLRESGETNMWAAVLYLEVKFTELGHGKRAHDVLKKWMDTFAERHP